MVCTQPIDFRKGIDSLVALIRNEFRSDPFSGVVWVFRSKRADRAKILWWDTSGIRKGMVGLASLVCVSACNWPS